MTPPIIYPRSHSAQQSQRLTDHLNSAMSRREANRRAMVEDTLIFLACGLAALATTIGLLAAIFGGAQ